MLPHVYSRKSRLSPRQQGSLMELFVEGSTARAAAEVTGVQANTVIRIFMGMRSLMSSKLPGYELSGEVEADESYFGDKVQGQARQRGRRQGSGIRPAQEGRRSTQLSSLTPLCCLSSRMKAQSDSIVYTDTFKD